MEVARAGSIGDPVPTVLETRVPDPDVERVEIAQRHARHPIPQKLRAQNAGLGEPVAFEAAANAVIEVDQLKVGVLIARIEMSLRRIPRLVNGCCAASPSVE